MLAVIAKLEAALKADWSTLTGDARRDAEQALADVKTALDHLKPAVGVLESDIEQAVEEAIPGVAAAVEAAVQKFLAALGPLLGAGM
jgi:hypothetical protein